MIEYYIFDPDYVVFEVAEYTLSDNYFNFEKMINLNFNERFDLIRSKAINSIENDLNKSDLTIEQGKTLTTIKWNNKTDENVWLFLDKEYDMTKNEEGNYYLSISNNIYNKYKYKLYIATYNKSNNSISYFR